MLDIHLYLLNLEYRTPNNECRSWSLVRSVLIQKQRLLAWQRFHTVFVKLNNFPRTGPDALFAVRAPLVDDGYTRFHQLDGIFRAHADAATAEVALARHDMDHEWSFTHGIERKVDREGKKCNEER